MDKKYKDLCKPNADLPGADLPGADLSSANLSSANLSGADLTHADLSGAGLSGADLYGANLTRADLSGADLTHADLTHADLTHANLSGADLTHANLTRADLSGADLSGADLTRADLYGADLTHANLTDANLSGAEGLLDPVKWLNHNFTYNDKGLVCYKAFNVHYRTPESWEGQIKPGGIITEVVNPLPTSDCGCGVNVATIAWVRSNTTRSIWKCLIPYKHLPSVVVPYNTDGKFRCGYVQLIEKVR